MSHDSMDVMIPPDMVTEDGIPDDEADASSCDGVAGEDESLCPSGDEEEDDEEEDDEDEDEGVGEDDEEGVETDGDPDADQLIEAPQVEVLEPSQHENSEQELATQLGDRFEDTPEIIDVTEKASLHEEVELPPEELEKRVIQERGLEFDMNEPWQRSLLREFQAHYDQPRVRNPAQLVMVGHTESRDFALELGRDDFTLTTDSSSTIPHRSQVVHRPWIYHDDSALFEDEHSTVSGEHSKYKDQYGAGARVSPRSLREERDAGASYYGPGYYVPPSAKHAGMHARQSLNNKPQWLEMENSRGDDHDDATTVAVASNQDACFCMGYNVLDLWMPPITSSKVRRKRRIHGKRRVLGRVAEGSHENSYDRNYQLHQKLSGRTDPDGAYNDQHYSTADLK